MLFALAALFAVVSYAQTTITGTVTSGDDGSPLPYASVLVQGTKTIVFTDDDGKFEIKAPSNATLVFQLSGFADEVVPVNNRSVINAVLKMETTLLDETIVVAYGTAKKGTYTGAASVFKF